MQQIKYTITNNPKHLLIKAEIQLPKFNLYAIASMTIFLWLFDIWFAWFLFVNEAPAYMYLFWILIVLFSAVLSKGTFLTIKTSMVWLLEVDKENKQMNSLKDNFSVKTSEIEKVSIADFTSIFGSVSKLKIHLINGEKTLMFPLDSYAKAEEVRSLIADSIQ